jgi:hypothetical protein
MSIRDRRCQRARRVAEATVFGDRLRTGRPPQPNLGEKRQARLSNGAHTSHNPDNVQKELAEPYHVATAV